MKYVSRFRGAAARRRFRSRRSAAHAVPAEESADARQRQTASVQRARSGHARSRQRSATFARRQARRVPGCAKPISPATRALPESGCSISATVRASPEKIAPNFVASSARWSPDGKDIYFLGSPKGGKLTGVYRVHVQGGEKNAPESLTPYKRRRQQLQTVARRQEAAAVDRRRADLRGDAVRGKAGGHCVAESDRQTVRQTFRAALGHLVRRQALAALHHRRECRGGESLHGAAAEAAQQRHRRRRALQTVRRRERIRVFARRQNRVLRRAHRRPQRSRGRPTSTSIPCRPTHRARRRISPRRIRRGMHSRCRPPTARRLYYLAMKRPGFEARSFRHHGARSGQRKIARDRSAVGSLAPAAWCCRRTARRCTPRPTTTAITRCSPSTSPAARRHA